eukprot:6190769-Pleurochrysis_carterae.AAC.1
MEVKGGRISKPLAANRDIAEAPYMKLLLAAKYSTIFALARGRGRGNLRQTKQFIVYMRIDKRGIKCHCLNRDILFCPACFGTLKLAHRAILVLPPYAAWASAVALA